MRRSYEQEEWYQDTVPAINQGELDLRDLQEPQSWEERIERLNTLMDAFNESVRREVVNKSDRIFPIKVENDFAALEMDFGAPSVGLHFFPKLVDSARAFRYDPVHSVESEYRTNVPQAIDIGKGLQQQGYKIFDTVSADQYPSHIHFANGGVTRAFSDLLDIVIHDFNKVQAEKIPLGKGHGGVLIVPVPTYGLFFYQMQEMIKDDNIQILAIPREENGAVKTSTLNEAMQYCRENNLRALMYYDCNPNNPTGYIRQRDETIEIAKILMDEGQRYMEEDEVYFETNGFPPGVKYWPAAYGKPQGKILIIDDMAYEGLEHTKAKKPFSFGQVSEEVAEQTAVLKGVSKIGMPGARIGLMAAPLDVVSTLNKKQLFREFSAHTLGVDILWGRFGASSPFKQDFEAHEDALRAIHVQKAGIVDAFFRGLDHAPKLTDAQKEELILNYAAHKSITREESEAKLKRGLAPFNVPDELECGFFHRVYNESLRGRRIAVQMDDKKYPYLMGIHHSSTMHWVYRSFDMHVVSSSGMGCQDNALTVRVTRSVP